jgi:hypothetical protein
MALLLLAVSAVVGAWTIPDDQPPSAGGNTVAGDSALPSTDSVISVYLPTLASDLDPDTWLRPGHVFISNHPWITQLYRDGVGTVYLVNNNVERGIDAFSLVFVARAEAGGVHAEGITTDSPGRFDLSQIGGTRGVTCTFMLTGVMEAEQSVELGCMYREDPGSSVDTSETVWPEPFRLADANAEVPQG